jgi:hypothetical protein
MSNDERKIKSEIDRATEELQEIIDRIETHHDAAPGYMGIGMACVLGGASLLVGFIAGYTRL